MCDFYKKVNRFFANLVMPSLVVTALMVICGLIYIVILVVLDDLQAIDQYDIQKYIFYIMASMIFSGIFLDDIGELFEEKEKK